jgi:hypothetical protein
MCFTFFKVVIDVEELNLDLSRREKELLAQYVFVIFIFVSVVE